MTQPAMDRLTASLPTLYVAGVVYGLGLVAGLVRSRLASSARAVLHGDAIAAIETTEASGLNERVEWTLAEGAALWLLPVGWWIGFALGPETVWTKTMVNGLIEPPLVALLGVGYLEWRRATERRPFARVLHAAGLVLLVAGATAIGVYFPELGSNV